jgi:hypothetical protein
MHLDPKQQKHFNRIFNILVNYAGMMFDIIDTPLSLSECNENYDKDLVKILERLWSNVGVIDRLTFANTYGLTPRELKIVKSWKFALQRNFLLVKHEDGYSYFMADGKAYGVIGVSREISTMTNQPPCFVRTALLPFEGDIVYDTRISNYHIHYLPKLVDQFSEEFRNLEEKDRVYWKAQSLIDNAGYHLEFSHQRQLDQKIDEFQKQRRLTNPEEFMPHGFHKGKLAGLPFRQREAQAQTPQDESLFVPATCKAIPQIQALLQFFDIYVPDGQDDLLFANTALALIINASRKGAEIESYLEMLTEKGFVLDSRELFSDFLEILLDALNANPVWPSGEQLLEGFIHP